MNLKPERISIVVTSYSLGRLADVKELIVSVYNQTYSNVELVLVIEGSRALYDALASMPCCAKNVSKKMIFTPENVGLSAARNLGFAASTGNIIAFTDDDVVLDSNWAAEVVKAYNAPEVIGTTGHSEPLWIGGSLTWLPAEFYWLIGSSAFTGFDKVTEVRNAWGWGMSFRREVFDKGCRFNVSFGYRCNSKEAWGKRPPEDVDFSLMAKAMTGGKIVFVPSARLKHKVTSSRFTIRLIAEKSYFSGRQRRMIKKNLFSDSSVNSLSVERDLAYRILLKTFPKVISDAFKRPLDSWRQFSASVFILFLLFIGFYTYR